MYLECKSWAIEKLSNVELVLEPCYVDRLVGVLEGLEGLGNKMV